MLSHQTIKNLPNNNRFYILIFSVLLSVFLFCWLRVNIPSDQLFYIRTEQVFGFVAIAYLYTALIISPIERVVGQKPWIKNLLFARRAIGVSAAYFALLHTVVALWGQIGGIGGLALLPERFVWAIACGGVTLTVLLLMAATSFDKVIAFMTFRKWKWLHRFIYIGSVLLIVHVWMIGTHIAYDWVRWALFVPLCVLFALEAWTIVGKYADRHPEFQSRDYYVTTVLCIWLLLTSLLLALPVAVQNYHSQNHSTHDEPRRSEGAPVHSGGEDGHE